MYFLVSTRKQILTCCFFLFLALSFLGDAGVAQTKEPTVEEDEILSVIVLARHGIRAPIESEIRASAYNAQPWPVWPVVPGDVTPHGAEALRLLGNYYRLRYPSLLEHASCENSNIYVEANTTSRTIASAKAMLTGLAPKCSIEVHFRSGNERNPLFSSSNSSPTSRQQLVDATRGRMADHPDWFTHAFAVPLAQMHHMLMDCSGKDCDASKPDFRTVAERTEADSAHTSKLETPVTLGADFAENFLLQYTEGMPMNQVGWGRLTRNDLDQLMEMNTRYHDFMLRTPYSARMVASDLAKHIRDTIVSAATGQPRQNVFGKPQDHFVLLVGHDSNLSSLGGLLRIDWLLQDQTFNATPPGGALVFEVHKDHATGAKSVRVLFLGQTLDQMRYLRPLQGEEQPSISPIFVPGCSRTSPGYACSIEDFDRVVNTAIDSISARP